MEPQLSVTQEYGEDINKLVQIVLKKNELESLSSKIIFVSWFAQLLMSETSNSVLAKIYQHLTAELDEKAIHDEFCYFTVVNLDCHYFHYDQSIVDLIEISSIMPYSTFQICRKEILEGLKEFADRNGRMQELQYLDLHALQDSLKAAIGR